MLSAHRSRVVAMLALLEEQRELLDAKPALGCAPAMFDRATAGGRSSDGASG